MNGPTRRVAGALFAAFAVLLGAVTWFQVVGASTYRSDPRNTRTAIFRSTKERGVIATADGTVLAVSEADPADARGFVRRYPQGPAFTPVVGYTSLLVGDSGLEDAFGDELRSRRDLTISDLIAVLLGRDLRPLNLQVTIDPRLQRIAYQEMEGRQGAVVALDPKTGAVLALVSAPSFDAQTLLGRDAVKRRQALLDDTSDPLLDRATEALYPPASTFKVLVTAAAFDAGIAGPETTFPDPAALALPGSTATIHNFTGRPCDQGTEVTLQVAFVRSCNTTFAQLAETVGANEIGVTADGAGFNQSIPFPWKVAQSSFPTRDLVNDPAALAQSGIGGRDVRATPLQMAMVAAAVANDGMVMEPRLVSEVFNADGNAVRTFPASELSRAMSPATAKVLGQLMERVVTEGTGRRAAVPGIRVAGKTGTTDSVAGSAPDVWFIGFAPVEAPSIALAVLVESGGRSGDAATGGSEAAPIASHIIEQWLSNRS